jgi:uncharacterized ferredoxin-like protein
MPKIHLSDWPFYSPADLARREGSIAAAKLMANAAFTAPKSGGVPTIECEIVYGQDEQEEIARKMEELSLANPKTKQWKTIFRSEAIMVRESDCILFIGSTYAADMLFDVDCGLCGGSDGCSYVYNRKESKYGHIDAFESKMAHPQHLVNGPLCSQWVNDLGIAVGSAAFLARNLLVDSRPMMSVGVAGQKLGCCPNSDIVVGLPVASLAKNPYVDITPDYEYFHLNKVLKKTRKDYSIARMVHWFDYRSWYPKGTGKEG